MEPRLRRDKLLKTSPEARQAAEKKDVRGFYLIV